MTILDSHQSLKNVAIVERLFWQLGTCFSGNRCCREVAVGAGSAVFGQYSS